MKNTLALSTAAMALLTTSAAYAQPFSDCVSVTTSGGALTSCAEESSEPPFGSVSTLFSESGQDITGSQTILLSEPGSSDISDIVTASITSSGSVDLPFFLTVTLRSDTESPLTFAGTPFESIPETGGVQDLTSDFTKAFDLNTGTLPTVTVMSDLDAVPEPSTWALMGLGFAALGFAGWRSRAALRASSGLPSAS
jgi:hypothetical protein